MKNGHTLSPRQHQALPVQPPPEIPERSEDERAPVPGRDEPPAVAGEDRKGRLLRGAGPPRSGRDAGSRRPAPPRRVQIPQERRGRRVVEGEPEGEARTLEALAAPRIRRGRRPSPEHRQHGAANPRIGQGRQAELVGSGRALGHRGPVYALSVAAGAQIRRERGRRGSVSHSDLVRVPGHRLPSLAIARRLGSTPPCSDGESPARCRRPSRAPSRSPCFRGRGAARSAARRTRAGCARSEWHPGVGACPGPGHRDWPPGSPRRGASPSRSRRPEARRHRDFVLGRLHVGETTDGTVVVPTAADYVSWIEEHIANFASRPDLAGAKAQRLWLAGKLSPWTRQELPDTAVDHRGRGLHRPAGLARGPAQLGRAPQRLHSAKLLGAPRSPPPPMAGEGGWGGGQHRASRR